MPGSSWVALLKTIWLDVQQENLEYHETSFNKMPAQNRCLEFNMPCQNRSSTVLSSYIFISFKRSLMYEVQKLGISWLPVFSVLPESQPKTLKCARPRSLISKLIFRLVYIPKSRYGFQNSKIRLFGREKSDCIVFTQLWVGGRKLGLEISKVYRVSWNSTTFGQHCGSYSHSSNSCSFRCSFSTKSALAKMEMRLAQQNLSGTFLSVWNCGCFAKDLRFPTQRGPLAHFWQSRKLGKNQNFIMELLKPKKSFPCFGRKLSLEFKAFSIIKLSFEQPIPLWWWSFGGIFSTQVALAISSNDLNTANRGGHGSAFLVL